MSAKRMDLNLLASVRAGLADGGRVTWSAGTVAALLADHDYHAGRLKEAASVVREAIGREVEALGRLKSAREALAVSDGIPEAFEEARQKLADAGCPACSPEDSP